MTDGVGGYGARCECHSFGSGFGAVIRFSILKFSFRKWRCCSDFSGGFLGLNIVGSCAQ